MDSATIGLVLGLATALRFVVGLVGAELSDRVGRPIVLVVSMAIMSGALLVFPLATSPVAFVAVTWLLAAARLGNTVPVAMLSDAAGDRPIGSMVGTNEDGDRDAVPDDRAERRNEHGRPAPSGRHQARPSGPATREDRLPGSGLIHVS